MLTGPSLFPKSGNIKHLVVIFHGYGADGENLISLGDAWQLSLPDTLFIAPNGLEPCEMNPFGYQWFGIRDFNPFNPFNMRRGLDKARPVVKGYLEGLLRQHNLTANNLVVVGFSQGGMLALDMMFAIPGLAGVISYAGIFYPPPIEQIPAPQPNVLLVHGDMDMAVPFVAMAEAKRTLKIYNIEAETLARPGLGHMIDMEGLNRGEKFLQEIFTNSQPIHVYT